MAQAHRLSPQQPAVSSVLPVRHNLPLSQPVSLATTTTTITTQRTLRIPLSPIKHPRYSVASQIRSNNNSNRQAVVDCLAPTWRPQSQAVYLGATQLQQAAQAVVYLEIQRLQLLSQPRLEEVYLAHPRSSLRPQQPQEVYSALAASQQTTKRLVQRELQVVYSGSRNQPHQQEGVCLASLRLQLKACCMLLLLRL